MLNDNYLCMKKKTFVWPFQQQTCDHVYARYVNAQDKQNPSHLYELLLVN